MNEQKRHHKAKQLEKVFQKVREHEAKMHHPQVTHLEQSGEHLDQPKVDVLNLPPRREVHQAHEKGLKIKFSQPFWRLLIVLILLLIVTSFIIYDLFFR